MIIQKIFGTLGCSKCVEARRKFPEADYIDLNDLDKSEYEKVITKAQEKNQSSLPLLFDDNDNLVDIIA